LQLRNIFSAAEEAMIVEHMNQDHQQNLQDYARFYLQHAVQATDSIGLCGLDQFGMDLTINETKHRIEFKSELGHAGEARGVLVEMAKAARAAGEQ
jgi:heme iron utilization protein